MKPAEILRKAVTVLRQGQPAPKVASTFGLHIETVRDLARLYGIPTLKDRRLQRCQTALGLLRLGLTLQDVSNRIQVSKGTVWKWLKSARTSNPADDSLPRNFTRHSLDPYVPQIRALLRQDATQHGYPKSHWTMQLLSEHIHRTWHIKISRFLLPVVLDQHGVPWRRSPFTTLPPATPTKTILPNAPVPVRCHPKPDWSLPAGLSHRSIGKETRRLEALRRVAEGKPLRSVARELDLAETTLRRLVALQRTYGDKATRARPIFVPALHPRVIEELPPHLARGAMAYGWPTDKWTKERVAGLIHQLSGVRFSRGHAGRLLRRHEIEWRRPGVYAYRDAASGPANSGADSGTGP